MLAKIQLLTSTVIISLFIVSANATLTDRATISASTRQSYTNGMIMVSTAYQNHDSIKTFGAVSVAKFYMLDSIANSVIKVSSLVSNYVNTSLSYSNSAGNDFPADNWVQLFSDTGSIITTLFTAPSHPIGNFLPVIAIATSSKPAFVNIYSGKNFSSLGRYSSVCWNTNRCNAG